jgi:hypothetical protein
LALISIATSRGFSWALFRKRAEIEARPKRPTRRRTARNGGTPVNRPYETCIVGEEELLPLLNQGWEIVKELSGGRIILRRPNAA